MRHQGRTVPTLVALGAAGIAMAAVMVAWEPWGGAGHDAAARAGPIEPATPRPGGPTGEPAASPPGGAIEAAVIDRAWVADSVLHWTQATYDFAQDGIDPNNGLILTGETWVRIGDEGTPVEFIGRYATEDGTVVQAIHQTTDSQTVAFAEPVPSGHPDGSVQCAVEMPSTAEELQGVLPAFIGADALRADGFVASSADAPTRVAARTAPAGDGVLAFTRLLAGTGANLDQTVRIDAADGRLATWHSIQRSGGIVTAEHIESYGAVSVLPAAAMPNGDQILDEVDCDD